MAEDDMEIIEEETEKPTPEDFFSDEPGGKPKAEEPEDDDEGEEEDEEEDDAQEEAEGKESEGDEPASEEGAGGEGVPEGEGEGEEEAEGEEESPRFEVTIDGERREVPLEEIVKGYQEHHGSQKRFQEAAQLRKQAKAFWEGMQRDPLGVVRQAFKHQVGGDAEAAEQKLRQTVEGYLAGILEEEALPPEEKIRRREARVEEERERLAEEREILQRQEVIRQKASDAMVVRDTVFRDFGIELDSPDGRLIDRNLALTLQGGDDITKDLVEGLAREAVSSRSKLKESILSTTDVEELMKSHPALVKKIRKADLKSLKQERTTKAGAAKEAEPTSTQPRRRRVQRKPKTFSSASELSDYRLGLNKKKRRR